MNAPVIAGTPLTQTGKDGSSARRALAIFAPAGLLAVASQLPAAAAPDDTSADTTIANVAVNSAITLEGLTPSFTLTGLPGAQVTETAAVGYSVLTNNVSGYTVSVQANKDVLLPAGDSTDFIPIAALQVRPGGNGGAFTPMSFQNALTLRDKPTRSGQNGDAYTDDYRIDI